MEKTLFAEFVANIRKLASSDLLEKDNRVQLAAWTNQLKVYLSIEEETGIETRKDNLESIFEDNWRKFAE